MPIMSKQPLRSVTPRKSEIFVYPTLFPENVSETSSDSYVSTPISTSPTKLPKKQDDFPEAYYHTIYKGECPDVTKSNRHGTLQKSRHDISDPVWKRSSRVQQELTHPSRNLYENWETRNGNYTSIDRLYPDVGTRYIIAEPSDPARVYIEEPEDVIEETYHPSNKLHHRPLSLWTSGKPILMHRIIALQEHLRSDTGRGHSMVEPHSTPNRLDNIVTDQKHHPKRVSVLTPRYYRSGFVRVSGVPLHKPPSKLCLPVLCQPEYPALVTQQRKYSRTAGVAHRRQTSSQHQVTKHGNQPEHRNYTTWSEMDLKLGRYEKHSKTKKIRKHNLKKTSLIGSQEEQKPNPRLEMSQYSEKPTYNFQDHSFDTDLIKPSPKKTISKASLQSTKVPSNLDLLYKELLEIGCIDKELHDKNKIINEKLEEDLKKFSFIQRPSLSIETFTKNELSNDDCKTSTGSRWLNQEISKDFEDIPERDQGNKTVQESVVKVNSSTQSDDINSKTNLVVLDGGIENLNDFNFQKLTKFDGLLEAKNYIIKLIDRGLSKELGSLENSKTNEESSKDMLIPGLSNTESKNSSNTQDPKPELALDNDVVQVSDVLKPSTTSTGLTEEDSLIKQLNEIRKGCLKNIQEGMRQLGDLERFSEALQSRTILNNNK